MNAVATGLPFFTPHLFASMRGPMPAGFRITPRVQRTGIPGTQSLHALSPWGTSPPRHGGATIQPENPLSSSVSPCLCGEMIWSFAITSARPAVGPYRRNPGTVQMALAIGMTLLSPYFLNASTRLSPHSSQCTIATTQTESGRPESKTRAG